MTDGRWRAAPEALRFETLDALTAVYHRPSGQTHLLAEPAPQILRVLAEPMDAATLMARLSAEFAVEGDPKELRARIEELAEAGLIAPA